MVMLMRRIITFIMLLMYIIVMPILANAKKDVFEAPENISVSDYAEVLSTNTKAYMMSANETLVNSKGAKIVFVTVPTTEGERINLYAERLYKSWNIKNINNGNDILVLFATNDMQYWVYVPEQLKSVLAADIVNKMLMEQTESDFSAGNFDSSARKLYDSLNNWFNTTYKSDIAKVDDNNSDKKESVNIFAYIVTALKWLGIVIISLFTVVILFIFIRRELRLKKLANQRRQRRLMRKEQMRREMENHK